MELATVARLTALFISLCRCVAGNNSGRIRREKHWRILLAILTALSASLALADDFKTVSGKEYKNATVSRVEADGIVIRTKGDLKGLFY